MSLKSRTQKIQQQLMHDAYGLLLDTLGLWPSRPRLLTICPTRKGTDCLWQCSELLPDLSDLKKTPARIHPSSYTSGQVHYSLEFQQRNQHPGHSLILTPRYPRGLIESILHLTAHGPESPHLHIAIYPACQGLLGRLSSTWDTSHTLVNRALHNDLLSPGSIAALRCRCAN